MEIALGPAQGNDLSVETVQHAGDLSSNPFACTGHQDTFLLKIELIISGEFHGWLAILSFLSLNASRHLAWKRRPAAEQTSRSDFPPYTWVNRRSSHCCQNSRAAFSSSGPNLPLSSRNCRTKTPACASSLAWPTYQRSSPWTVTSG